MEIDSKLVIRVPSIVLFFLSPVSRGCKLVSPKCMCLELQLTLIFFWQSDDFNLVA